MNHDARKSKSLLAANTTSAIIITMPRFATLD